MRNKRLFYERFGEKRTMSQKTGKTTPQKIDELRKKLAMQKIAFTMGSNVIEVNRENLFEDSLDQFMKLDHQKELKIMFQGEMKSSGQDAGGMEKEWFTLISQEFLNPDNELFRATNTDEVSYVINEMSGEVEDAANKFKFFGLMLAKAIFDEIPLNLWMNRLVFKLFLDPDAAIELEDIKNFDSSVYQSLKYLRDNNVEDDEYLEFYFQHEFNGEMYPLVPDGETTRVDDDNKESFITLKIEFMVKNFMMDQLNAIREGFEKLINIDLLFDFSDVEFGYLWCGENELDLQDWKTNTFYECGYSENHRVIKDFWEIMGELDQQSLQVIFQFVTGMSRLPAGGFNSLNKNRGEKLYFTIRAVEYEKKNPYIRAFTCFNRLHLPIYPNIATMKKYIDSLIEQKEIFGFGLED